MGSEHFADRQVVIRTSRLSSFLVYLSGLVHPGHAGFSKVAPFSNGVTISIFALRPRLRSVAAYAATLSAHINLPCPHSHCRATRCPHRTNDVTDMRLMPRRRAASADVIHSLTVFPPGLSHIRAAWPDAQAHVLEHDYCTPGMKSEQKGRPDVTTASPSAAASRWSCCPCSADIRFSYVPFPYSMST